MNDEQKTPPHGRDKRSDARPESTPEPRPDEPTTDSYEADLASQFRRGSAEAVETVRARVRRIIAFRGYGIPRSDRDDLVQEVMTQTWQAVNRAGFDTGRSFWGFVEVVSARRCIDWLRGRKPNVALVMDVRDPKQDPLASTLREERSRLAYGALAQLGKPCRDLVYLHVGLGKSYAELSELLDKSEGALRVQLHRCIAKARKILPELSADPSDRKEGGNR